MSKESGEELEKRKKLVSTNVEGDLVSIWDGENGLEIMYSNEVDGYAGATVIPFELLEKWHKAKLAEVLRETEKTLDESEIYQVIANYHSKISEIREREGLPPTSETTKL
jgi:hypothetical protein